MDEVPIIRRAQGGDERAARQLFDTYQTRTYRLALGLLGDGEDAEEVAQDALAYALLNIDRYRAELSSFSTWLHTITVSRARDKRRRKILPSISMALWLAMGNQIRDYQPGPEAHLVQRETEGGLALAVEQLSPKLREAVVLRFYADCTYREMGEIMGCSLNTARSRLRLAVDMLRTRLGDEQVRGWAAESSR